MMENSFVVWFWILEGRWCLFACFVICDPGIASRACVGSSFSTDNYAHHTKYTRMTTCEGLALIVCTLAEWALCVHISRMSSLCAHYTTQYNTIHKQKTDFCTHAYIYTYIHTYIHTYIRTYIHTYIQTYRHVPLWFFGASFTLRSPLTHSLRKLGPRSSSNAKMGIWWHYHARSVST